jgi:hypothetical protein
LSSSRHRLFNFLDKRRTTERSQSDERSVGPVITLQAGEKHPTCISAGVTVQSVPGNQDVRVGVQGIYW